MLPIIYFAVFFAKQSDIKISKLEIALAYLWAPMIFQNLWFTPNLYSQAIALIGLGFALVAIYLKWKRVKSIKKMIVLNLNELEY